MSAWGRKRTTARAAEMSALGQTRKGLRARNFVVLSSLQYRRDSDPTSRPAPVGPFARQRHLRDEHERGDGRWLLLIGVNREDGEHSVRRERPFL